MATKEAWTQAEVAAAESKEEATNAWAARDDALAKVAVAT